MSKPESWRIWEGRSVSGKFPLRQWLGGSDHSAVFLTERPGGAKAAIKLIAGDPGTAEQDLARMRTATRLSHPNLIRVFEAGRGQVESDSFIYVVMEFADEDLAQILPQRPLAPDEVSDLLPPLLEALTYLHSKGFVHSRIKPSNILAAGNQLKLSADQVTPMGETGSARRRDVYDAPETAAGILSPASDVWSLGVTLVAAITQNVALAEQAAPGSRPLPESIPEPYRSIARECLQLDPKRRSAVRQIQTQLLPAGRAPAPAIPPPTSLTPAETAPRRSPALPEQIKRTPMIGIAGAVIAILIVFAFIHSRGNNNAQPSNPDTGVRAAVENKPSPAPETPARRPGSTPAPAARSTAPVSGEVRHRVIPDIPKSARNTIHGTIKVSVHVDVGPSGKVIAAKFRTSGPSRYFAQKAMNAAEQWEFAPPRDTTSFLLNFYFRRSGTDASSQPVSR
jgi:TonB family protein